MKPTLRLSLASAALATLAAASGCHPGGDPEQLPTPQATRKQFAAPGSPEELASRQRTQGVRTQLSVSPAPGAFRGVVLGSNPLATVPVAQVSLQSLMYNMTYSGDIPVPNGTIDTIQDHYVLRNCETPVEASLLNEFGSPKFDSLHPTTFNHTIPAPQVNQLRFLLKGPKSIMNQGLRLELLSPQQLIGAQILTPSLDGRGQHGANLSWAKIPQEQEILKAWELAPEWEEASPGEVQAKVVVDTGYIPGHLSSEGYEVTTTLYARVVPTSATDWSSSNPVDIRTIHVDFCKQEKLLHEQAAAMQAAHEVIVNQLTTKNINSAPYMVSVVGYEPPTAMIGVPGCNDGLFVHTGLMCTKQFPPYKGKGNGGFWSGLADMLNTVSAAFESLKSWVASMAAQIVVNFTPLGWSCQGLDYVAGTDCAAKMTSIGKTATLMAINYGLASMGVPPSIPNTQALINSGADYLAATAMDQAATQMGVDLPDDVKGEMTKQISTQVKSSAPAMELQSQMSTIQNSDRAKGHWFPEPLCEQLRLTSSFSNWYKPQMTVYVRVDKMAGFSGSDKNWAFWVRPQNSGLFKHKKVMIPNSWPAGTTSMVIPVVVEANFDYFASSSLFESTEKANWNQYAWGEGTQSFQIILDLFNSDMHTSSSSLQSCKTTLGIGCAPYPILSGTLTTGQRWGIGSAPKLMRACTQSELNALQWEPPPY
jgi:hypothetical protein